MRLFGFELKKVGDNERENLKSITPNVNDGSAIIAVGGGDDYGGFATGDAYGYSLSFDVDPSIVSEQQLITKYREIALQPEVEKAVDIIINEMVSTDSNNPVSIDLDEVDYSDELKEKITEEFRYILNLMDFNANGWNICKRWYVDGRLYFNVLVDESKYKTDGIGKLVYIDPRKIKKVRMVKKEKDERTGYNVYQDKDEFFIYSENGFINDMSFMQSTMTTPHVNNGAMLSKESVAHVFSGLLNPTNAIVLSYLHKAIRPLNQLRGLEDATIIYKLSRAPERRVFYIDVGNLPPAKADQHLKRQVAQYRSKMVYDTSSGTLKADPRHMTMIEDYFLPRRGDNKATEITTLPGGTGLGQMEEVQFFLNKLYNSLNVPITRMDPQQGFSLGRATEITRDEVFFIKFIYRLRNQFANLFNDLLKRQLALKKIISTEEFDRIKNSITYEWESDNHFDELVENDMILGRLDILDRMFNYRGVFFSDEYIRRNILRQSQEEIDEIDLQIKQERKEGKYPQLDDMEMQNNVSHVVHKADNNVTPQGGGGGDTGGDAVAMPQAPSQEQGAGNLQGR